MAYDANGNWKDESESVADRVTSLTSKDNAYMQQARSQAARAANGRGLINSSIAAGAGEDAAIKSALPIATHEASLAGQRNVAEAGFRNQQTMQQVDNEAQMGRLQYNTEANAAAQQRDIDAARTNLHSQLTAQAELQRASAAAEKDRLGMQLTAAEKNALVEQQAQMARLQEELGSRERLGLLDAETRQGISQAELAATERERTLAAAAQAWNSYSNAYAAIMQNPEIPAATRAQALESLQRHYDSNLALIEQIQGVDLQWGTSATPTPSTGLPYQNWNFP